MRITLGIISKFPPTSGQVSTLNLWLAIGLALKGHRVVVCADSLSPTKDCIRQGSESEVRRFLKKEAAGVDVHFAPRLNERLFFPFSDLSFTALLSSALNAFEETRPDVIFSHYLEPYALVGHLLASRFQIPHVITHAGSDINRVCSIPEVRSLYKAIIDDSALFVAKTKSGAALGRARTLDLGVKIAPYAPPGKYYFPTGTHPCSDLLHQDLNSLRECERPLFGFYGKFTHGKSLDKILAAFSQYRIRHNTGTLALVGRDIGGQFEITKHLGQLQLRSHIKLLPFMPNWVIPDFIRLCDAVLYTKNGYLVREHSSVIPSEVLACNVPLIATEESLTSVHSSCSESLPIILVAAHLGLLDALENVPRIQVSERVGTNDGDHKRYINSWERSFLSLVRAP